MSAPILADSLVARFRDLERRLAILEKPPPPTPADVAAGDITAGTFGAGVLLPASQVVAGTFGAGSYTFSGGKLTIDSTSATNVVAAGTGAGYQFYERDDSATSWVWYATGDTARLWRSAGGDLVEATATPALRVGIAEVYQYDSTYAGFRHKDNTALYQILVRNTGLILLNGDGTDERVLLGTSGSWWLQVSSGKVAVAGAPLEVAHGASNGLKFAASGAQIWTTDSSWLRFNKHLYSEGNTIYSGIGTMRTNGKLVAQAASGSTGLYLYSETDTNHRVFYDAGGNGPRLYGYGSGAIGGVQHDSLVEAGRGSAVTRHVNLGSSVWRASNALIHNNMSDSRFKRGLRQLPRQVETVRTIKPIEFQWDERHDVVEPGRWNFGFNADDLPPEVTETSFLINEETGEPYEVKMVNPQGLLAMLWEAFLEMADENDAERERVRARLDAIERAPRGGP